MLFALLSSEKTQIICSDYNWIGSGAQIEAKRLHKKYKVSDKITYEDIDATCIPYENEFDIIFFKSILGGIGRNGNVEMISKSFDSIYNALKPGGRLYYVENIRGSKILQWFRRRFSTASHNGWNYLEQQQLMQYESQFIPIRRSSFGYIACIGPNELSRNILGIIDIVLERFIRKNYIYSCVLEKKQNDSEKHVAIL